MIVGIMESQPPRTEENFNGRVGKVIFSCPSFVGENHQEVGCRRSERRALIGWRVQVKRGQDGFCASACRIWIWFPSYAEGFGSTKQAMLLLSCLIVKECTVCFVITY